MLDMKKMKLVGFEKAQKLMHEGVRVSMVHMDGTLVELTELTDWKTLSFHNNKGGGYAVFRMKLVGEFHKEVRTGKKVFAANHTKKGGDFKWIFVFYKGIQ